MFNLKEIMIRAWRIYRANVDLSFPEALHRSWLSAKAEPINAERITEAKAAAGIDEETRTWAGWREIGREVIHGSKALFGAILIWGSKGDGATYRASFFGLSQTCEIGAQ